MRGSTEPSDLIDGLTRIFSERGLREEGGGAFSEVLASSIVVRFSAKSGGRGEGRKKRSADGRHPQGG